MIDPLSFGQCFVDPSGFIQPSGQCLIDPPSFGQCFVDPSGFIQPSRFGFIDNQPSGFVDPPGFIQNYRLVDRANDRRWGWGTGLVLDASGRIIFVLISRGVDGATAGTGVNVVVPSLGIGAVIRVVDCYAFVVGSIRIRRRRGRVNGATTHGGIVDGRTVVRNGVKIHLIASAFAPHFAVPVWNSGYLERGTVGPTHRTMVGLLIVAVGTFARTSWYIRAIHRHGLAILVAC